MSATPGESTAAARSADRELVMTRAIDAPRELVFKAWTDPEHVVRWWGPNGFTTPICKIDARPGGIFRYCMRSPEGRDFWGQGVYREVAEPERIVFTDTFSDAEGNPVPPAHYGMSADFPSETLVTVTFAEGQGKTRLTLRSDLGSASAAERDMCQQGWAESLDRLAGCLARDPAPVDARSEALARQFEAKAREAAAVLDTLSEADWRKVTDAEKWTVGVTAHHLASALEPVAGMIAAIASGQSLGHFTSSMLDELNARHAREHANCTRAETIALLEKGGASAAAVVRGLRGDQLARSATVFADAPPMTVEQLVTSGLIVHIDEHFGSIRKTVAT